MFMMHTIMQEAKISPLRKRNGMIWGKGVSMQRSCPIFPKIFMHNTLILMLKEYIFMKLNDLKCNHI